jgi:D-ribose pyranose/furanose isomerase RbsD
VEKSHEFVQTLSKLIHHLKVKRERYHNELRHYNTLIEAIEKNNDNIAGEIEILRTTFKTLKIKSKLYEETMFIRRDRLEENHKLKSMNNSNLNHKSRRVYS